MQYVEVKSRKQCVLFPQSLDEIIDDNNDVRFIDLFAESIDVSSFSFIVKESKKGLRLIILKICSGFIYGYLNGIRSYRALEKQFDEKTYRHRLQIIERTYGIIKRQWGFYYITTKRGMKRGIADLGLMFMVCNLRPIINLIG